MYQTWGFTTKWVDVGDGPEPSRTPPPIPVPFVPHFESAVIRMTAGAGASWQANSWYFATAETAKKVMELLHGLGVLDVDSGMTGPFVMEPPTQRFIVFVKTDSMGKIRAYQVNAGLLAANWTRNPEDQFPGVALSLALAAVEEAGRTLLGF